MIFDAKFQEKMLPCVNFLMQNKSILRQRIKSFLTNLNALQRNMVII